jgi:hypothetical protein
LVQYFLKKLLMQKSSRHPNAVLRSAEGWWERFMLSKRRGDLSYRATKHTISTKIFRRHLFRRGCSPQDPPTFLRQVSFYEAIWKESTLQSTEELKTNTGDVVSNIYNETSSGGAQSVETSERLHSVGRWLVSTCIVTADSVLPCINWVLQILGAF